VGKRLRSVCGAGFCIEVSYHLHPHHAMWSGLNEFSSRSRADLSRELGWNAKRTRGDFVGNFEEEVRVITAEFNDV
jgi:hypothetical protein